MATQLQIRRGTTAQMNAFTGAEGELAVNTSTDTVHVHDGSTAGGFALAKADGSNIGTYAGSFTTLAASGASTLTGAVGINIAPTSYKLTVNSGATTETTAAAIGYNGDAGTNLYINTDHGNNLVSLYASGDVSKTMRFMSGTLEVMRLGTTGNVGVGTSAPASLLDVSSTGEVISTVRSTSTSGARQATLRLNVPSTGGDDPAGRVQFTYGTGYTVAGSIEMTHTNPAMKFLTGSTEAMRISGSNVGIGNLSPSSYFSNARNLVVGGTTGANGMTISGSTDTQIFFADGTSGADAYRGIIRYSHADNGFSFWTNATRVLDISSTGSVGIGTTSTYNMKTTIAGTGSALSTGTGSYAVASIYDTATAAAGTGGGLAFQGDDGINSAVTFATVNGSKENATAGNYASYLGFSTRANGGNLTEKVRISSAGLVGVNNPNPAQTLSICNPANPNRNGMEIAIGAGDTSSNTIQNYNRATGAYTPLNIASSILTFGVGTSATERMRITSAGKLIVNGTIAGYSGTGITIGSPSAGSSGLSILSTTTGYGYLLFGDTTGDATGGYSGQINYAHGTNRMGINTNGSERMAIDSSGNVMVGCASVPSASVKGLAIRPNGTAGQYIAFGVSLTQAVAVQQFINPNGVVGSIQLIGSATQYLTSSDYRLKENVVELTGATDRLKQLNPSRFNFIADADTTVDGFLAHEVQDVVPEAITGAKDAVDADGNPDYQGIDQSKLVPLLVATIQELEARLTELENK